jgi:hypothetical protein
MNLGKLLGAGKSFFGGSGVISYRADKRVYLPKFNAAKNPFEPKPVESSVPVVAAPISTPVGGMASAEVKAKATTVPRLVAPKPSRTVTWTERLNPFRGPEPVAPELPKPVQAELSLQAVKVLHNDLSDADVEVVPVKSRTLAVVESPRLLPGRETMEFFGERQLETV